MFTEGIRGLVIGDFPMPVIPVTCVTRTLMALLMCPHCNCSPWCLPHLKETFNAWGRINQNILLVLRLLLYKMIEWYKGRA